MQLKVNADDVDPRLAEVPLALGAEDEVAACGWGGDGRGRVEDELDRGVVVHLLARPNDLLARVEPAVEVHAGAERAVDPYLRLVVVACGAGGRVRHPPVGQVEHLPLI